MDKIIAKICALFAFAVSTHLSLLSAEKLPSTYQIPYGDPKAPIQITEYFSLSCPQCIKNFLKDFKILQDRYVKTGHVYLRFHPHPADLLTLQAMVCLEKLQPYEKIIFWEVFIEHSKEQPTGCQILQITMDALGKPLPFLDQLDYVKKTNAFKTAYQYLEQPDIVHDLPTVEINGILYDEFPHFRFIERKIKTLLQKTDSSR